MNVVGTFSRKHQTAVFVDGGAEVSIKADRVTRLSQSLNGSNIKADVFVVEGKSIHVVGDAQGQAINASPVGASAKPIRANDASEWAAAQGYAQVLIVTAAGASLR